MLGIILTYLPSLLCGIHVVRSGRVMFWLWLFIIGPLIAPAFYFFAVLVPEWTGSGSARKVGKVARQALDPERDYRNALRTLEDTPTVGARMKVAHAAAALGRWADAEAQWTLAGEGAWSDDPAILMGHALSLLELSRYADALAKLEKLKSLGREGETNRSSPSRAYEGLAAMTKPTTLPFCRGSRLTNPRPPEAFMVRPGVATRKDWLPRNRASPRKDVPPLRPEARVWRSAAKALPQSAQRESSMGFKCDHMLNVGKSTLFNALTNTAAARGELSVLHD